jgi:hypothetical protein
MGWACTLFDLVLMLPSYILPKRLPLIFPIPYVLSLEQRDDIPLLPIEEIKDGS